MSPVMVELQAGPIGFTDDKDEAKRVREETIIPTLAANDYIVLDFCRVKSSTQSFVHALLGEALQRFREAALERIQFKNCTPLLKNLIQLVVDYSLGGFRSEEYGANGKTKEAVKVPMPRLKRRTQTRTHARTKGHS